MSAYADTPSILIPRGLRDDANPRFAAHEDYDWDAEEGRLCGEVDPDDPTTFSVAGGVDKLHDLCFDSLYAFAAQIKKAEADMHALREQLNEKDTDLQNVDQQLAAAQDKISALRARMQDMADNNEGLRDRITDMESQQTTGSADVRAKYLDYKKKYAIEFERCLQARKALTKANTTVSQMTTAMERMEAEISRLKNSHHREHDDAPDLSDDEGITTRRRTQPQPAARLNPAATPFQLGRGDYVKRDEPAMFSGEAENDKLVSSIEYQKWKNDVSDYIHTCAWLFPNEQAKLTLVERKLKGKAYEFVHYGFSDPTERFATVQDCWAALDAVMGIHDAHGQARAWLHDVSKSRLQPAESISAYIGRFTSATAPLKLDVSARIWEMKQRLPARYMNVLAGGSDKSWSEFLGQSTRVVFTLNIWFIPEARLLLSRF